VRMAGTLQRKPWPSLMQAMATADPFTVWEE
jgi:hypothetical protein